MNEEQRPKVGIGVMVFKDGKVLLGKRKNIHGDGEYAALGGHLEYMESFEDCARREVMEETGLEIDNIQFLALSNLKKYHPHHYVNIGLIADWKSGEPQIMEPEKIEGWDWYDITELPHPLFEVIPNYIEAMKSQKKYWDV